MKIKNWSAAVVGCASLMAGLAQAVQTVDFANLTLNAVAATSPMFVVSGDAIKFDASLTANGASNPPGTTGLGLCLEYKQSAVNDPNVLNLLATDNVADGTPTALSGCVAGGATLTPGADFMVIKAWAHIGSGGWPNVALPVKLYDAEFTLTATPAGSTQIGFGASSVASGQTFTNNGPVVLCGKPTVTTAFVQNGAEQGSVPAILSVQLSAAVPAACGTAGVFPVTLALGGTATNITDYAVTGTGTSVVGSTVTVDFPANGATSSINVSFTPVDDNIHEVTETVTLTVNSGTNYIVGGASLSTANIVNNDPRISVAVTQNAAEPATNGIFTFTRVGETIDPLVVNFTLTGTATTPADYTVSFGAGASAATTTSITFNVGATTAVLNVNVVDDILFEGIETVILTVSAAATYTVTGPNPAAMNIVDDELPINVSIVATTPNAAEGGPNGLFTVTRTSGSAAQNALAYTVNLLITGTATNGTDYTAIPGTVTILANQTTATIPVTVSQDTAVEGTETVIATVQAGIGYAVGAPASATVNIADDDLPPLVTVSAKTDGGEPATNGSFTLTRLDRITPATSPAVPLNFTIGGTATRGTDYTLSTNACGTTLLGNALTIPAAATTVTVTVCVIDDAAVEGLETVILTIAAPTTPTDYAIGAPATQTVNISDDDGPLTVTIAATTQAAEPATNGLFTVTRSGGGVAQLALPLTVNLAVTGTATGGTDYTAIPATVTILANQSTATIPVTVVDDTLVEGTETVILTIQPSVNYTVGAPAAATVNITDDDVPINVSIVASLPNAAEPATNGQFTVTRSSGSVLQNAAPLTVSLSIGGTAINGTDYVLIPGTVTILANQTTATIPVTVTDDSALEGPETVIATVLAGSGYVVGAPSAATVTIADNEIGLGVVATVPSVIEGGTVVFTLSCPGVGSAIVNYSFSGTYVPLPANGSQLVNCGTPFVINVPTVNDLLVNGTRTIILTITGLAQPTGNVVVDPANASATALVLDDDKPLIIPTLGTLGLTLLGLLLAASAGFSVRRRRS